VNPGTIILNSASTLFVDNVANDVTFVNPLANVYDASGILIIEPRPHGIVVPRDDALSLNVRVDLRGVMRVIQQYDVAALARCTAGRGDGDPVAASGIRVSALLVFVSANVEGRSPTILEPRRLD